MAVQEQPRAHAAPDFATFMADHIDELATAWTEAVREQLPHSRYARMPREQMLSGARIGYELLVGRPTSEAGSGWPKTGIPSPRYLVKTGFDIEEVMDAVLLSQEILLAVVQRDCPPGSSAERLGMEVRKREHGIVRDFTTALINEARRQVAEEKERTAMMLEAARAASSTLNLNGVLKRAGAVLAAATGASHCWFYMMHRSGGSGGFWADSGDPALSSRSPVDFPATFLYAPVLKKGRTIICGDVPGDPTIQNDWALMHGLKSVLSVPLIVEDRLVGAAVALCFARRCRFTPGQVEMAQGIANVVAPAIENARLHSKVEKIAVMEERLRLAREFHDNLAQDLGYLIMKISTVSEQVTSRQDEEVEAGLSEMARTAEQAYLDLREAIFGLRVSVHSGPEFWPALQEYVEEYQANYGVETSLLADQPAILLSPKVGVQLSRIILEALSNVRKHSKAARAWIRVHQEDGQINLTIEDDGLGFDPDVVTSSGGSHIGMEVMRERAEIMGGAIEVDSGPGKGTRVTVRLPIA